MRSGLDLSYIMKIHIFTRQLLSILFLIVFLGVLLVVVFLQVHQKPVHTTAAPHIANLTPAEKNCTTCKKTKVEKVTALKKNTAHYCTGCRTWINKVLKDYSLNWTKNEGNYENLRFSLINCCNGIQKAAVTQTNTPLGTLIVYDGERRNRRVNKDLFNNFPKIGPFFDKTLDTCAVVGNGGILANSLCGEAIDSAQFVIRCNLPPLEKWHRDVGKKVDLVTANPTIFIKKYSSLQERRRAFVDNVTIYGDSLLFLPAFSFAFCTGLSMRVHYTLEDFRSPVKSFFLNPDYSRDLDRFWRSQGLNPGFRMSTGFMMVSLALEICNNVSVFGFWPFQNHPYGFQSLTQHYFDNMKPSSFHKMSAEFAYLVQLHNQGVLKLHVGECSPQ